MAFWNRRRDVEPETRVASVEEYNPGGTAIDSFGRRAVDPRQVEVRRYARDIGMIGTSYEFMAHQAARCPLRPEVTDNGVDWEPVDPDPAAADDVDGIVNKLNAGAAWDLLRVIRPARGEQADLVKTSVYLDETQGEFWIVPDPNRPDGMPAWSARSVQAVAKNKSGPGYVIMTSESGRVARGTAFLAPAVWRHWQAAADFEDQATCSLIKMATTIETYWRLEWYLRRQTLSRIAMNDAFWTPESMHRDKWRDPKNGEITKTSVADRTYAQVANESLRDHDDRNVLSIAPFPIHSPGNEAIPQLIKMGGLDPNLLSFLQDQRELVANGIPITTQAILDGESNAANHWNKWAGDDADVQTVEVSLRRSLASWTEAVYRPKLRELKAAGLWSGDPEQWRIGADVDPIKARPDNAQNALALPLGMLSVDAMLEATHFKESDKADPDDWVFYGMVQQIATAKTTIRVQMPPDAGTVGGELGKDKPGAPPIAPPATTVSATAPGAPHEPPALPPAQQAALQAAAAVILAGGSLVDDRELLDG